MILSQLAIFTSAPAVVKVLGLATLLVLNLSCASRTLLVTDRQFLAGEQQLQALTRRYNSSENPEVNAYLQEIASQVFYSAMQLNSQLRRPQIVLLNSAQPMALTTANCAIVIAIGTLRALRREGELVFVLAHEFAHILHGDPGRFLDGELDTSERQQIEYQADRVGLFILQQAGFHSVNALSAIALAGQTFSGIDAKYYPNPDSRIRNISRLAQATEELPLGRSDSRDFRRIKQLFAATK